MNTKVAVTPGKLRDDHDAFLPSTAVQRLKQLIWLYFWLLMFEGAVRKWIPPLSFPFLIVRDPVALVIWIQGARLKIGGKAYWQGFYLFCLLITLLGFIQVIVKGLPFLVFLYGWRSYVLHLPVILVAASLLEQHDLRRLGRWILLLSLPMTLLMVAQYLAPPESFLNRGASEEGGQITAALGHIRPAGTFSFITGPIEFIPLVGSFFLLGLTRRGLFPRWLVVGAGIALVIVIPVSGSRTVALTMGLMVITGFFGVLIRGGFTFNAAQFPKLVGGVIVTALIIVGVSQLALVQDAINTFATRWTQAQGGTGNAALESRILEPFIGILNTAADASVVGVGIGAGSQVGSIFLGNSLSAFNYGEGAWERELYELGSWVGLAFVACRAFLAVALITIAFRSILRGMLLPWYLLPIALLNVLQGALDQTTSQGFLVLVTAITLAALKQDRSV